MTIYSGFMYHHKKETGKNPNTATLRNEGMGCDGILVTNKKEKC